MRSTGWGARVGASDPLTGEPVEVKMVSRGSRELVIDVPATDSPRLTIEERASAGLTRRLTLHSG